jgi:hypothetical protein
MSGENQQRPCQRRFDRVFGGVLLGVSAGVVLLAAVFGEPRPGRAQTKAKPKTEQQDEVDKEHPLRKFMYGKLAEANQILTGLVTEDFKLVRQSAAKLEKMSSLEKWRVSNDVMYRQHTSDFQKEVARLAKAAEKENLDRATLAYIGMTMNCVECHKWVRKELVAD